MPLAILAASGRYTPYYSRTGTVTSFVPEADGKIRRPSTRISDRVEDSVYGIAEPYEWSKVTQAGEEPRRSERIYGARRVRPMSLNVSEMQEVLSAELRGRVPETEQKQGISPERQSRRELYEGGPAKDDRQISELKQQLRIEDKYRRERGEEEGTEPDLKLPPGQQEKEIEPQQEQQDVFEEMKNRISEYISYQEKSVRKDLTGGELGEGLKELGAEDLGKASDHATDLKKETDETIKLEEKIGPAGLGEFSSFAALSKDKFNRYMKMAEDYMHEGRYYRAAEAYEVASFYKPRDPLAFAGRGHALLAAGEYMSSALFLERAIESFPEYVWFKVNLQKMVGSKDALENRIAEIEKWQQRSNSGQLSFLLGYVYHQMNRIDKAEEYILTAHEIMPDSVAVSALKKAIEAGQK